MAELDDLGEVSAGSVAVINGLLGQSKVGGERFGREELLHGSRY